MSIYSEMDNVVHYEDRECGEQINGITPVIEKLCSAMGFNKSRVEEATLQSPRDTHIDT